MIVKTPNQVSWAVDAHDILIRGLLLNLGELWPKHAEKDENFGVCVDLPCTMVLDSGWQKTFRTMDKNLCTVIQ